MKLGDDLSFGSAMDSLNEQSKILQNNNEQIKTLQNNVRALSDMNDALTRRLNALEAQLGSKPKQQ
jgi:archaellum component FlaC